MLLDQVECIRADLLILEGRANSSFDVKAIQLKRSLKKEMRQVERDLWVLEGILVHGLKSEMLESVKRRH